MHPVTGPTHHYGFIKMVPYDPGMCSMSFWDDMIFGTPVEEKKE